MAGHPNFFLMEELSVKPKAYFLDREWLRCGSLLSLYLINNGKNQIIVTVTSRGFLAQKLMGVLIVRSGFEIVVSSNI